MGSDAHVVLVDADPRLLDRAEARVAELESAWSRFRPDSDISRLNAANGAPVAVSAFTVLLVERSVEGWALTGGRFDPTVLDALEASGYDRPFDDVRSSGAGPRSAGEPRPSPGLSGVAVDRARSTVRLPPGTRFDPGGIGKGLAADLVAAELLASGAGGACVNLGGDVRVVGTPPTDRGWDVAVEAPRGGELARVLLLDGAVCTSSRLDRCWLQGGEPRHHLIDPATGAPAGDHVVAATVVASTACQAELLTKLVMVAGPASAAPVLRRLGATGLAVTGLEPFAVTAFAGFEEVSPCSSR